MRKDRIWMMALVAAFQLLTRFPMPRTDRWGKHLFTDEVLRRSVVFYPVAGLAIGGVLAAAGTGLGIGLGDNVPLPVSGALLVVLWVGLTGGLHLDGLMDTADGLLSGQPRERMLEIMKDSRAGAMGVIACVLLLIVKTSLLLAWLDALVTGMQRGSVHAVGVHAALLMLVPVWSRWFIPVAMAGWDYARQEGMGGFFRSVGWLHAIAALLVAWVITALVVWWMSGSVRDAAAFAIAFPAAAGVCGSFAAEGIARRLGGLTGDTYGALVEGLETALLLGAVLWLA